MRTSPRALLALLLIAALTRPAYPQAAANGAVSRRFLTLYDWTASAETYCSLSQKDLPGTAQVTASASNTLNAVSGTPFATVNVGDELTITTGVPAASYTVGVSAKASSAQLTTVYRDPVTLAAQTLTIASGAFVQHAVDCGTGNNNGVIPMGMGPFTLTITFWTFNFATRIDWRLLCRSNPVEGWKQVYPELTPPAAGPTYISVTAANVNGMSVSDSRPWDACKVGILGVGADGGSNLISINVGQRNY